MTGRRPAAKVIREDEGERLLVEAAQKDPARFAELYEIHFTRVYAFVARRVRDRDRAEDLTSEVFHKALANLRTFEWRGAPFSAWLVRIAANLVIDQGKRAAREMSSEKEAPEPSTKAEQEDLEERGRLFRMVEQLPSEQRRVIFARFVEQRSIREIAQQLGKTEGAIKQLQFRALQKLRDRMEGVHG
jgi:RNA polymerase sigma-70 factor (ECF subfamily)